jgi:hypothetical protein
MANATDFFSRIQRKVDRTIDETFYELINPGTTTTDLERQMPATNYASADLLIGRIKRGLPTVGSLVAPEQEIPTSRPLQMSLDTESMSHLKIGKAYTWGETELRRFYEMQMMSRESGNQQLYQEFENQMIWNLQTLAIGVNQKSIVLGARIQSQATGVYTDPLTNIQWQLDYSDKTIPALTPPALTTTNRWTQAATCKPLEDLRVHARAWYDSFGMYPREVTMRRVQMDQIIEATHTKTIIIAERGGDNPSAAMIEAIRPTEEQIVQLIRQYCRIESVTINDSYFAEERGNPTTGMPEIVQDKYVPENTYYFTEPGNIERAWVPTAENRFRPGLFQLTEEVSKAPIRERSVVIGCCVPVAMDPRKIAYRKVA